MCDERVRLHGLDLSTKHVVSDIREPEMKKPRRIARLYICGRLNRRYDRGTGAMHLANTPVVSPESKNPALAGFSLYSNCSLFVAAIVAQLCQA
ncbi:hypothetical protein DRK89_12960 [Salmonella enterica subsp. enterica]|nr:hypothetical protein [Salmonella enterica subsp. enterica serovar London]